MEENKAKATPGAAFGGPIFEADEGKELWFGKAGRRAGEALQNIKSKIFTIQREKI